MTNLFRALCCVALLLPFTGFAQVVRPELIRTAAGATFVFNTAESFFAVDVAAAQFDTKATPDGYHQADARLIRLTHTPQKELTAELGNRVPAPKELLQLQFRRDLDEEQFSLQRPVHDSRQEFLTTPKGRLVLHWWFALPSGSNHGATQQHYVSTVCDRQILSISAPLLVDDTPDGLRQYLVGVMQTVRESNDPINVSDTKELPSEK